MKSDKGLRNQDAQEADLLPSDKVYYLKLEHFWNVFFLANLSILLKGRPPKTIARGREARQIIAHHFSKRFCPQLGVSQTRSGQLAEQLGSTSLPAVTTAFLLRKDPVLSSYILLTIRWE